MAAEYLFGLEAINFGETIFDTEDLSTIRGASLGAIESVAGINISGLQAVTLGGSSGVWRGMTDDPALIVQGMLDATRGHIAGRHLCFAAASQQVTGDFLKDRGALKAKLARDQLRLAGTTYPETASDVREVCPVDMARPVQSKAIMLGGSRRKVSQSVLDRRSFGLSRKQGFLANLLHAEGKNAEFAMLLSSIAEHAAPPDRLKQNLQDKIAVIHIDGNGLSALQSEAIAQKAGYDAQIALATSFDQELAGIRSSFASSLFDLLISQNGAGPPSVAEQALRREINRTSDQIFRFEALLWAGDEMTFIVPARLGWQAAQRLMAVLGDEENLVGGRQMSAAIGLVFCHLDAPIARIRTLAERLCSHAKSVDRNRSLVFPIVLESFDHIGNGLDVFLQKRRPASFDEGNAKSLFLIGEEEMESLQARAGEWAKPDSELSRRQLRINAVAAYGDSALGDAAAVRDKILIEEFWDYLNPLEAQVSAVANS